MDCTSVTLSFVDLKWPINIEIENHICLSIVRVDYLLGGGGRIGVIRDRPVIKGQVVLTIVTRFFV